MKMLANITWDVPMEAAINATIDFGRWNVFRHAEVDSGNLIVRSVET